jgi:hypothetical protein
VFLSSVFNSVKIAEPMGVSILTAGLRARGRSVRIAEPSVRGWSVAQAVDEVVASDEPIVAVSVLRDKNVRDVRAFVEGVRARAGDKFIVLGGHGPSISLADIPNGVSVSEYLRPTAEQVADSYRAPAASCSTTNNSTAPNLLPLLPTVLAGPSGPVVNPALTDRGKGAGDIDGEGQRTSSYFDLTPDYLAILEQADACLLGESDHTFPDLVDRVLAGTDWSDVPGLARVSDGVFYRNPLSPKIVDLDALPHMSRDVLAEYQEIYQRAVPASILASRGCYYRCTFCSVVKYEQLQAGSKHRQRSNADLVREIDTLHRERGVTTFNFEDDNFIVKNAAGVAKLFDLCDQILALDYKISFAFFCRADVVREDLFARLKEAGLSGIYFGLESVHEPDLKFFHKGLSVGQMYDALTTLNKIGFSPAVDAAYRIMLGYITWHPMSTFDSLRASARFIQEWSAPPKLLRRKLRVYAGTEVIGDVARMGLLNAAHPDGWNFLDSRLENLDAVVNDLFGAVNKRRDMVRTLEKAEGAHGYDLDTVALRARRIYLDNYLCEAFEQIIDAAEATEHLRPADSPEVRDLVSVLKAEFEAYSHESGLIAEIEEGYARCGFQARAVDLFRK